jgi:Flp pilus assembly protein TadG
VSSTVIGPEPSPAHHPRGERGAATVEFALVLPVLLMVIVATVQVGRGWDAKLTLSQAVRQGARVAALGGSQAAARDAVADAADSLTASELSVTAPASTCSEGQMVTVQATYTYTLTIPLMPERDITMTSASSMRCGG